MGSRTDGTGWDAHNTHTEMERRKRAVPIEFGREFCADCWGQGRIWSSGVRHACTTCGGEGYRVVIR